MARCEERAGRQVFMNLFFPLALFLQKNIFLPRFDIVNSRREVVVSRLVIATDKDPLLTTVYSILTTNYGHKNRKPEQAIWAVARGGQHIV